MKKGALVAIFLFLGTITLTVISHQKFHMPTTFGMITGLGVLSLFGFYLKKTDNTGQTKFDIFTQVGKAEWDTLLFFYGVLILWLVGDSIFLVFVIRLFNRKFGSSTLIFCGSAMRLHT